MKSKKKITPKTKYGPGHEILGFIKYSKTYVKRTLSKGPQIDFQDQLSLNAGQGEHSAILLTFIKLTFVTKSFVLSIFEWPFYTSFTVCIKSFTVILQG